MHLHIRSLVVAALGLVLATTHSPALADTPEDPSPPTRPSVPASLEDGAEAWAAPARTELPPDGERLAAAGEGLRYQVVDLGDGAVTNASDINEDGLVSGTIFIDGHGGRDGRAIPVAWQGDRLVWLDSGAEQRPLTRAIAVGDDGTVGGWQIDPESGARYAVTWSPDEEGRYGDLQRVSAVTGWPDNVHGGEVDTVTPTGSLLVTEPTEHVPFGNDLIMRDGTANPLPPAAPYTRGVATYDANASESAVGYSSDGNTIHATVWQGGGPTLLPELIPDALSRGMAINDDGDVVVEALRPSIEELVTGTSRRRSAPSRSCATAHGPSSPSSTATWPATPTCSRGTSTTATTSWEPPIVWRGAEATTRAFLWSEGEIMDLNDVIPADAGWDLLAAHAINERGQIVGLGIHDGVPSAFMLDPTRPLLFVPGAGASILKSYDDPANPRELWLGCGQKRIQLSRFPEDGPAQDVRAVDVTRYLSAAGRRRSRRERPDAYGGMLDQLRTTYGYREYRVEEQVERFTTEGCDLTQRGDGPNLFVFAYDWRQDNRLSARQLEDFIGCIQRFYPGTEIDVATHSMGSLVARRYIMNNRGQTGCTRSSPSALRGWAPPSWSTSSTPATSPSRWPSARP